MLGKMTPPLVKKDQEEEANPYASPRSMAVTPKGVPPVREVPAAEVPSDLPTVLINEHGGRGKGPKPWRLVLGRDELWLVPSSPSSSSPSPEDHDASQKQSPPAVALTHLELTQHCDITIGNTVSWLSLRRVGQRVTLFRLDSDSLEGLRTFIAPMRALHIERALKKRLRFSSPIGLFFVVSSLPILGFHFDILGLIFGAGLVALSGLASLRTHVSMFLVDAALWLALALLNLRSVINGSLWSLIFVALSLFFALGGVRAFLFYRRAGIVVRRTAQ
jgi:hypothetical protein